ncbi:MAG: ABC transporter permease [Candidatus Acidiferrales bacterium]
MNAFLQDLRYALRMLLKSPGFTAAAVLTLALGTGANTAIFSMVNWLVLKPLPIQNPGELTYLSYIRRGPSDSSFSNPEFEQTQKQTHDVFRDEAAQIFGGSMGPQSSADGLTVDGKTEPLEAVFVSGNFFSVVGVQPYLGRFILPSEGHVAGADPVVVLSYRYWKRRFAGDPAIMGKKAAVNGHAVTIIGVTRPDFWGITPIVETQGFLPLGMSTANPDMSLVS